MTVATAIAAAGTIVSAVGTFSSMQAQAQAASYNAKIQERSAQAARDQASADRQGSVTEGRRKLDRIRALYARSGVVGGVGTALEVYQDQATENKLADLRITYAGENKAIGHKDQAALDKMDAKRYKTASMIGLAAGVIGAGSSLIGGTGNFNSLGMPSGAGSDPWAGMRTATV